MPENIVLDDLATPAGKAGLKDYLLKLAEDIEIIYTETAPNGSLSARRGKVAIYKNGTTYEQWQNVDGGTTWQRTDLAGIIGGFTVSASSLTAGTGASSVGLAPATYPFYAGNATPGSAPFYVTAAGAIGATSGIIGGWTLATDKLTGGAGATYIALIPGTGIQMGNETFGSAPFSVTNAGVIKATSGAIGGWTLASDKLSGGSGASYIGLIPGTGIQLGAELFASAPFSVTNSGVLKAISGVIGGWTLAATTLVGVGTPYLIIDSANSRIRTSDYVSGALGSGWHIGQDIAEFNNIRARGKITTSVFEKEAISIVGGNLIVLGGDILDADMTALDASTLTISGDITLAVNDILRIKDGTDDEWFQVTVITSAPTYTVTRDKASAYAANTNPIWKKGTAIVNYGQSGAGGVFLTSSEGNSPYISFFTHAGSPWTTLTQKARLGNLAGIPGCTGYGIWGGAGYLGALEVIDTIKIGATGAIRSNLTGVYPYVEFSNAGLMLKDSDTGGTYGVAKYGTDKYGFGALAWIMNSTFKIPWVELKEPSDGATKVASMRLYNRGSNPDGAALVGDIAVVNGKLVICTGAGTPGTWQVVGAQTA